MTSLKRWVGHCFQKNWAGPRLTVDNVIAGGQRVRAEATGSGDVCGAPGLFADSLLDPLLTSDVRRLTAVECLSSDSCLGYWLDFPCSILILIWWWFSYLNHNRHRIFEVASSKIRQDSGAKSWRRQTTWDISIPARWKRFSNWKLNKRHREWVIPACPPAPSTRPSHSKHSIPTG